jgi:hypothetical protein
LQLCPFRINAVLGNALNHPLTAAREFDENFSDYQSGFERKPAPDLIRGGIRFA